MTELQFVLAPGGNAYVRELLELLCGEMADRAVAARVVRNFPTPSEDAIAVALLSEYHRLAGPEIWPTRAQIARTIALGVEPPGSWFFEQELGWAAHAGAAVEISVPALRETRRRGIQVDHAPLGWSPRLDRASGVADTERDIDVIFLGALTPRRGRGLACASAVLDRWTTRLFIAPEAAKPDPGPDFVLGDEKLELLARSRALLDIHRTDRPYFTWLRHIEAIVNGCVVVTEPSADTAPLEPGEHFVAAPLERQPLALHGLLLDDRRVTEMRTAAADALRADDGMSRTVELLASLADDLVRRPVPMRRDIALPTPGPPAPVAPTDDQRAIASLQKGVRGIIDQQRSLGRRLARAEARLGGRATDGVADVARTASYDAAEPRITVVVPVFQKALVIGETLASLAAQNHDAFELVLCDDASTDGGTAVIEQWFEAEPWLPGRLISRAVNGGSAAARNDAIAVARGDSIMILDADDTLRPRALARLESALVEHPSAWFAYPILEMWAYGDQHPIGIVSAHAWRPELFIAGNYIGATALVRRSTYDRVGGYATDLALESLEDFDLWLAIAEAGGWGIHVPEMLSRYRINSHSYLSMAHIDSRTAWSVLRERHPTALTTDPYEMSGW